MAWARPKFQVVVPHPALHLFFGLSQQFRWSEMSTEQVVRGGVMPGLNYTYSPMHVEALGYRRMGR